MAFWHRAHSVRAVFQIHNLGLLLVLWLESRIEGLKLPCNLRTRNNDLLHICKSVHLTESESYVGTFDNDMQNM